MKFKLDENLGRRGEEPLRSAGYNVSTVAAQGLQQALDADLIEHCRVEGRCLVTLDLDFSNPLVYLPSRYADIAVLRLPHNPSQVDIERLLRTLIGALERDRIDGRLWIIEDGRVRIYQERETD